MKLTEAIIQGDYDMARTLFAEEMELSVARKLVEMKKALSAELFGK